MSKYYEMGSSSLGKAVRRPDTLGSSHWFVLAFGIASAAIAAVMILALITGVEPGPDSTISTEEFDRVLPWFSAASIVGAITGIGAGILIRKRRCWNACMALMCLAMLSTIAYSVPVLAMLPITIIMLAIGALMTVRVNANRDSFE